MSFGSGSRGGHTHLEPVGDVGIEGADMLHAPIEDVDGLLRRQRVLRVLAAAAPTAAQSCRTSRPGYSLRWSSMARVWGDTRRPRGNDAALFA